MSKRSHGPIVFRIRGAAEEGNAFCVGADEARVAVTARHVVNYLESVEALVPGHPPFRLKVLTLWHRHDLAILQVPRNFPAVSLPCASQLTDTRVGQLSGRLETSGYPHGAATVISSRDLRLRGASILDPGTENVLMAQLEVGLPKGMSGSPVMVKDGGRLVCVGMVVLGGAGAGQSALLGSDILVDAANQVARPAVIVPAQRLLVRPVGDPDPPLPTARANDPTTFFIRDRVDVLDLRDTEFVPEDRHAIPISESRRDVALTLMKTSTAMEQFINLSKTSGPLNEFECTTHEWDAREVVPIGRNNEQNLRSYELAIDVSRAALRRPERIEFRVRSFNKYMAAEHWWTSVLVSCRCDRQELVLLYRPERKLEIGLELKQRSIKQSRCWSPFEGNHTLDTSPGRIAWTIDHPEMGVEYALFWARAPFEVPQ